MNDLKDKKIVIAGGSGFLGRSMTEAFSRSGASVTVLSRSDMPSAEAVTYEKWDGRTLGAWVRSLEGADSVVNLAGRSVNCIKTPDNQDEILRSRVASTAVLGKAMRELSAPPPVWVQMSTAHIYGDPPEVVCTENSDLGIGFAPTVGQEWERAFLAGLLRDQRGVVMRTSFVVGRDRGAGGGALETLRMIARMRLGGRVGRGTQGMSWIHESDLNRLFIKATTDPSMQGVYIASAPNPVSQSEFMSVLRKVMGIRIGLPATEWMVRIGAPLVMRTDPELALYGRYVVSSRLRDEGFEFEFPGLQQALTDLLGQASNVAATSVG